MSVSLRRQSSSTKRPRSRLSVDHFKVSASAPGTQVRSRLAASCSFENTRWKYLSCGWLTAVSDAPPSGCSAARSSAMTTRWRTYPRGFFGVNAHRRRSWRASLAALAVMLGLGGTGLVGTVRYHTDGMPPIAPGCLTAANYII